jgi:hypothetical protein
MIYKNHPRFSLRRIFMKINIYKIMVYKEIKILGFNFKSNKKLYWIEYRIDENRFWYFDQEKKLFFKKINCHHSKQGRDDSIKIIRDIGERAIEYGYKVKEIEVFNSLFKIPKNESLKKETTYPIKNNKKENFEGIFLESKKSQNSN